MRTDVEAINYLCNKNNQVSSHFLINRIGKIFNRLKVLKRRQRIIIRRKTGEIHFRNMNIEENLRNLKLFLIL